MIAAVLAAAGGVAAGTAGSAPSPQLIRPSDLPYVSTQAALAAAMHGQASPEALRERARELSAASRAFLRDGDEEAGIESAEPPVAVNPAPGLFNADNAGVPQNEESLNACRANTNVVLGGTNDYRGLFAEDQAVTGWHFSTDSGQHLRNEGRLPSVALGGQDLPSQGDPVVAIDESTCDLFMVDLNFEFDEETGAAGSAVGVYRSTPATLEQCPTGGVSPSCWPTRRAAAGDVTGDHFLDKPWADVGQSAGARVVWVTYTDFGPSGSQIRAVRCRGDLSACSPPVFIDQATPDAGSQFAEVQFSYVTIGGDGRTYVSWTEVQFSAEDSTQTFRHQVRVAQPGSVSFGPARTVYAEDRPIPFGGFLHMADFRVATQPKNDVVMVDGKPRMFVTWDACSELAFGGVCIEPSIKLSWSDDLGATWTTPRIVSVSGDNYFPSISRDDAGRVVLAYFTNRFDSTFHQRQDVELRSVNATTGALGAPRRVTPQSNEPEADPLLGGFFIGDYLQTFAHRGQSWTHYNANQRQVPLLGATRPIPQQDNYLKRSGY